MYDLKSYEELEKIVNDWLTGDDFEAGPSTSSTSTGTDRGTAKVSSVNTSDKQYKSLDEAFADLDSF